MLRKSFFIITLIALLCTVTAYGQNTYSPYSMLGVGEIDNREYGKTFGMSGISIGMRDKDYLNTANPAAIGALDGQSFIFDVAASLEYTNYKINSQSENTLIGNFKKIALGVKLLPKWNIALGIKPFSDVGYRIHNQAPIEGTTEVIDVYAEGEGGLYSIYMCNAVNVTNFLSLGVNTMFLCGNIARSENQSSYIYEKESSVRSFYNTFGLQLYHKNYTLGVTYGYKQK